MYNNITVERLEQIERERHHTIADQAYQRWMQELKVGSRYIDRQPIHNANYAMQDWDSSRLNLEPVNRLCM